MRDYQREFIAFALQRGVLRFGEFTLKSGRVSPYFFNAGLFDSGASLARLGEYYARALLDAGIGFDTLFGPAYKGIPLVAATAIGLERVAGRDVPFAFDRKEIKDHGEGGRLVGAPLRGDVIVVDDVISAGTSVRESVTLIHAAGARLAAVVIALDRQERGTSRRSAVQEVADAHGVPVIAIADLDTLVAYLTDTGGAEEALSAVARYRRTYGAAS